PVAEVLDEAAAVGIGAGDERAVARLGQVAFDASLDQSDDVRVEGAPDDHGSVALEVVDQLRVERHAESLATATSAAHADPAPAAPSDSRTAPGHRRRLRRPAAASGFGS